MGRVAAVTPIQGGGSQVTIATRFADDDLGHGASIAVDGACLTVIGRDLDTFTADVSLETLERTTLKHKKPSDPVNLERPLRLGERLGGHLVLGHVDGVGEVVTVEPLPDGSNRLVARAPAALAPYLVERGWVTVDGASLTITTVRDVAAGTELGVALIPHTLAVTALGVRRPGDRVNLEADMIAKHVERLLITRASAS